tara:strand:- start:1033 stop:1266 length:234 start_codon:yes stop_codon:yes gene_type:complete
VEKEIPLEIVKEIPNPPVHMYDLVKERKKKQKKIDDYVFGINMYVTSRINTKRGHVKKTFKLKEAKIESEHDKVDDK